MVKLTNAGDESFGLGRRMHALIGHDVVVGSMVEAGLSECGMCGYQTQRVILSDIIFLIKVENLALI